MIRFETVGCGIPVYYFFIEVYFHFNKKINAIESWNLNIVKAKSVLWFIISGFTYESTIIINNIQILSKRTSSL